jgi:hypothetical protein
MPLSHTLHIHWLRYQLPQIWLTSEILSGSARMEDLAFSIDQRNATDWASASELAAPRNQQDQLPDSIQHRGQHVVTPAPSTLHDEPVDLAERPRQDGDNDGAAKLSMEETLWRYIPHDSDMARSIGQRSSRIWIIGEGGILRPHDAPKDSDTDEEHH